MFSTEIEAFTINSGRVYPPRCNPAALLTRIPRFNWYRVAWDLLFHLFVPFLFKPYPLACARRQTIQFE